MGLLDSIKSAARSAADSARRAQDRATSLAHRAEKGIEAAGEKLGALRNEASKELSEVKEKASKGLTTLQKELAGQRDSFGEAVKRTVLDGGLAAAIDVGALKKTGDAIIGIDEEAIGKELAGKALSEPNDVKKALSELNSEDKDDVSEELAKNLSDDQLEQLATTSDGRALLTTMRTELDDGPTWPGEQKQIDRIDAALEAGAKAKADTTTEAGRLDPNPSTSVLPSGDSYTLHGGGTQKKDAETLRQDAQVNDLVDQASSRARTDAGGLVKDTQKALEGLDTVHGGDLVARTADKLMAAGKFDDAKALLSTLKKSPYASEKVDLVGHLTGGAAQYDVPKTLANGKPNPAAGNEVHFKMHEGIPGSFGEIAQRRMDQIDQIKRMDAVLPKSVPRPPDPRDLGQVKSYFEELKKTKSMSEVGKEYSTYLANFAVHPGGPRTHWAASRSTLTDTAGLNEVLKGQPRDASGRTVLDCEGYTYLTAAVFGGKGNDVWLSESPDHITATVFDAKTGKAFHVNTANPDGTVVDVREPIAKTDTQRRERSWNYFAHNGQVKPAHADFAPPKGGSSERP